MKKIFCLALLLSIAVTFVTVAQSFTSVSDWPMPRANTRGLVRPAFKLVPRFKLVPLGNEVHVHLKLEVTFSTSMNPVAPYAYRYLYNGKEYTDEDLGQDVFKPIKLARAVFSVRVQGPNNFNKLISYNSVINTLDLGIFPKDVNTSEFVVHVEALEEISYYGTETIERTINNLRAGVKQTSPNSLTFKVNQAPSPPPGAPRINGTVNKNPDPNIGKAGMKNASDQLIKPTAPANDSFWTEKKENKSQPAAFGQPNHKNLPNFVRTTDGGYYYKGEDGRFRQVTGAQYQALKHSASQGPTAKVQQKQADAEEVRIAIDKMFIDARAQNDAINQKIEQTSRAWQQNFYYTEAVRNGKENLAGLSTLNGSFNSVAELEAEFNQKYTAIRYEVDNLEQARSAQLSNAVAGNFNGNSTEKALGQGVQLIGGIINSAKADKERKEAQAALKAERDRQLAAIAEAKKRARLEMRNKLLQSFPDGGTPLTAHKITASEVYIFAYITDKAAFNNETTTVSVSNVFPVVQYSDGTFPFKTTVANKIKGYAPGDVVLIGYYTDRQSAEQMRSSFISLAAKSELSIRQFALKTLRGSGSRTAASGDFWENGKKTGAPAPRTEKKEEFWNN